MSNAAAQPCFSRSQKCVEASLNTWASDFRSSPERPAARSRFSARTSFLRFCPNVAVSGVVILRRLLGRRVRHGFLLDYINGRAIIGGDGLAAVFHGDLR